MDYYQTFRFDQGLENPCAWNTLQIYITIVKFSLLDSTYSMLSGQPWLKHAKVPKDWGSNTIIIQGIGIVRTIHVTKKLGIETKQPWVLV